MGRRFSFTQLPIAQRLGIGFALAGMLAVIVALAVGLANNSRFQDATSKFDQALNSSTSLSQIRADIEQMHSVLSDQLAFGNSVDTTTPLNTQIIKLTQDVDNQINNYYDVVGQDNPQLETFANDWGAFRVTALIASGDIESGYESQIAHAREILGTDGLKQYATVLKDLNALVTFNQQQITQAHQANEASSFAAIWSALAWALVGFFVVMFLAWFIVFSIIRQLDELLRLIRVVNRGDLSQRVTIGGRNEVAVVGSSMNDMLDTIGDLLTKEEALRSELESEIVRLVDQVTPVGQGDLRLQAEVTNSQLGTLADVFNVIVEQLATLVARVQNSATLTYTAAGSIVQQASQLAHVADHQATQLGQANEGMGQLATAAMDVARLARSSAQTATETVNSAQRGGQATIQVLERVRRSSDQVRAVEEQMRVLNEHSKEISNVVALIEEIAKQTQLLSINAEVQAGQAGLEFSRGFTVVAEEIRRLAERTEDAVRQITTLVRTVQGDIYSVTITTGQTAKEFVDLTKLADEAGRALQAIWTQVAQQAKDIEAITKVSVWQESVASKAAVMIQNLATLAKSMGEIAQTQEAAARNMSEIAQSLRTSIAAFQLPAAAQPSLLATRSESAQYPLTSGNSLASGNQWSGRM
jgi:methyl-accepting chemotaxis protein